MPGNKAYLKCLQRQEAQELLRQKLTECGYFTNLPTESVPVETALGRVTAHTIYAKQSVPHYNGAAMDGIAVNAQDTFGALETAPKRLTLLPPGSSITPGCCCVVDTGDLMPPGTNAVIMIEDVYIIEGAAEIISAATPWQHVRVIGEDIVADEPVIPEYHVITPIDVAALLAAGLETVEVIKRPRVAVIPTGDEIVATRAELKPGAILDVNSYMLATAVSDWGGEPSRMPIVKDNKQEIKRAIFASLQVNDMVIVNAGTSAGRDDYTSEVLGELGEVLVHGVMMKPGKPTVLAVCQGKPVIGLPGYPVSAMLMAEVFARDVIYARQKLPKPELPKVEATLVKQVSSHIGVEEYVRVSVGNVRGKMVAAPLSRGAGLISSLSKAQGYFTIEPASAGFSAGTVVPVTMLRKSRPENTILAVGSHDLAVELLGVFLRRRLEDAFLSSANVGSMGGIMAIRNNEAHIAGIHMLDEQTGRYNVSFTEKYLANCTWQLVHMAMRQQGFMVLPGNPKGIEGFADLTKPDTTFVNRQRGSGTRMLLDYELRKAGINSSHIVGYEKEVGTHMAVAATVKAGAADTGLGVKAAAVALGLDFVPAAQEQYDLLLNFDADDPRLQAILEVLQSDEFRREVEGLGGYDLSDAGKLVAVSNK